MKIKFSRLRLAVLLLAVFWLSLAQAQDVQVRDDHPDEYVVVKGDTLWDISGRFLRNPWQWPAIWQANPQIENPHLIYPGDRVSLIYIDGKPQLVVNRDGRLGPQVRETSLAPIDTIPFDAIEQFLRFPRMLSAEQFEQLPYLLGNEQGRVNAVPGLNTYVRGLDRGAGEEVVIARLNFIYERSTNRVGSQTLHQVKRPAFGGRGAQPRKFKPINWVWRTTMDWADRPVEVVGVELWEIGRARVLKAGDPAILQILSGRREVQVGDYVLPVDSHVFDSHFYPRAMDTVPEGLEILNVSEAVYGVGHYGIVAINAGVSTGLVAGHTFAAFRPGEEVRDLTGYPLGTFKRAGAGENANVVLPHEYIGQVMVFRTFEHISYGIVLEGKRMVREADTLTHPAERL